MKIQGKCSVCGVRIKCFDTKAELTMTCTKCGVGIVKLKEKK